MTVRFHDSLSEPWTVAQLQELLGTLPPNAKLVFTHVTYGDFDLVEYTGSSLSEDNFINDRRPILRLQKRID